MTSPHDRLLAVYHGKAEPPAAMAKLGMKIVEFGEGKTTLSMSVDRTLHNPMGTLHDGMMTDLADASMGLAIISLLGESE